MKTSFVAIALSLAGAAVAWPPTSPDWKVEERAARAFPYSIGGISLKHLKESDTWDFTFTITHRSPAGQAVDSTVGHTAWTNGSAPVGPSSPEAAENPQYSFYFPTGAPYVEDHFRFAVDGPHGLAAGDIVAGNKYQCGPYTGGLENVDVECKTVNLGEFFLGSN
ncbi:hypothetical protein BJY04DRAFT_185028 [Aspergillus karnatakaensis]|uniref:uncharacterized protein n=1 Tax=Aspergillus karnatakaensis TaxID=1810916 RepID=UPI003CCD40E7